MKLLRLFSAVLLLVVLSLSLLPGLPAAAQVPWITLSPTSGRSGEWVTVNGTGFGTTPMYVYIYFGSGTTYVSTAASDGLGNFSTYFNVPAGSSPGQTLVHVTNSPTYGATPLAQAYFNVIAPVVTLGTTTGTVGSQATVSATNFGNSKSVTIYFDTQQVGSATANAAGSFTNATFTVPASAYGSHTVLVRDTDGNEGTATFTTTHKLTANRTSGSINEAVTLTGTGFSAGTTISITLGGTAVTTSPASVTAGTNGTFTASFNIPSVAGGTREISVSDGAHTATANLEVLPLATLSQASGNVGDSITINGSGFAANVAVAIRFDSDRIEPNPVAGPNGTFSRTITVPSGIGGVHQIIAAGSLNQVQLSFTIETDASLDMTSGNIGTEVAVTGGGFTGGSSVTVTFDGEEVATTTASSTGDVDTSFSVPSHGVGSYQVEISDGINSVTIGFGVETSASIDTTTSAASPGNVGDMVTLDGIGFAAGETVSVSYEEELITTTTVLVDGTYSVSFAIPPSTAGQHTIEATVDGVTSEFAFYVEAVPPPSVAPLKPEMGIKTRGETYFDWKDVTDPSGVTYSLVVATDNEFTADSIVMNITGLTESEYTVPVEEKLPSVKKEESYYWHVRAVDGAGNEGLWSGAGTFYVGGFSISLNPPVIYSLVGVGALVIGAFAGFWYGRRSSY